MKSLEVISTIKGCNFTVFTDCYRVLLSIKCFNSSHPLVQKVQAWLHRLASRFKKVQFCSVPAHVGIRGNELADLEARFAANVPEVSFPSVPHHDMWPAIRRHVRLEWQKRWSSPSLANNKKYKKLDVGSLLGHLVTITTEPLKQGFADSD